MPIPLTARRPLHITMPPLFRARFERKKTRTLGIPIRDPVSGLSSDTEFPAPPQGTSVLLPLPMLLLPPWLLCDCLAGGPGHQVGGVCFSGEM
jgi:hypothetical protein